MCAEEYDVTPLPTVNSCDLINNDTSSQNKHMLIL